MNRYFHFVFQNIKTQSLAQMENPTLAKCYDIFKSHHLDVRLVGNIEIHSIKNKNTITLSTYLINIYSKYFKTNYSNHKFKPGPFKSINNNIKSKA